MQTTPTHPPALALLDRSEAARRAVLAVLFGALTALSAQVSIPLVPVPVTGQVLMVLLSGALLGPRLGVMSQLTYLAFGLAGAPVFAEGKAGPLVLLGPTAGYLVAFPLAAFLSGLAAARWRSFAALAASLTLSGCVILLCGGLWLAVWMSIGQQQTPFSTALGRAFVVGVLPFLVLDVVKAVAAAAITRAVARRSEQP